MWRSMLLAFGLSLCLLGGEFMVVDRLVMADPTSGPESEYLGGFDQSFAGTSLDTLGSLPGSGKRVFVPPEWAPWGLLSVGAAVVLYASALGK